MSWKLITGLFVGIVASLMLWGLLYEFWIRSPKATVIVFGTGVLWMLWIFVKEITHHEETAEGDRLDRPVRRRAGSGLDPWDLGMGDD